MNIALVIRTITVFLVSLSVSLLLTPQVRKFALKLGYFDRVEFRKVHRKVVTRLGGIAIYISFWISMLFLFFLVGLPPHIMPIFLGSLVLLLVGIADDIKGVRKRVKITFQIIAASLTILLGCRIEIITIPFVHTSFPLTPAAGYLLSLFWILILTNGMNLIDGLDGLAAGISSIVCLILFATALRIGKSNVAIPFIALLGACLGFLRYNFHPAKVFMGDAGSTFLGFSIAGLTMIGSIKAPAVLSLVIPVIALGVPIADTLFAVLRRVLQKKSPFLPDKAHIHHRLLATGFSHGGTVILLYAITVILGLISILFIPDPTFFTGALILITIGILVVAVRRWKITQGPN